MRLSRCSRRAVAVALAFAAAPGLASSVTAQARSAEDARTIDSYRLTMPMLRKVLPALHAAGAQNCEKPRERDPSSLSLAQVTATLERCAPLTRSLRQAGVQPRDAAIVYAALLHVSRQVALRGGKATALPPGVVQDNALLLEQNDSEIRKLTKPGAQS